MPTNLLVILHTGHVQIFPLPSPSKTCALPFHFALERDPKNIFYCQCDVENNMDQVLSFLLFDRHEYIHAESSGQHTYVTGLFIFFLFFKI